MDELREFIQHPVLTVLSLTIGVIGVILTLRSMRAKRPTWSIHSHNLVSAAAAALPELDIRYGDRKAENLTVSRIAFWNGGTETIGGQDIAEADPLRVVASGRAELLEVGIIKANSPANRFAVTKVEDGKAAKVAFDFLDRGHGAVIQAIHTGISSEDLHVEGTVKGARHVRRLHAKAYRSWTRKILDQIAWLALAIVLFDFAYVAARSREPGLALSLIVLGGAVLIAGWWYVARTTVPRGLEEYGRG